MGRSPLFVTRSMTRFRPRLIRILSCLTTIAPGAFSRDHGAGLTVGKAPLDGTGRKDPYNAASRSPSSVQIGSCTVTRNTLRQTCDIVRRSRMAWRDERHRYAWEILNIPIWERPLDLNIVEKSGNTRKDMFPPEHRLPMLHELGDGMSAIPDTLLQLRCDKSNRFRLVQLQTARETLLSEKARLAV